MTDPVVITIRDDVEFLQALSADIADIDSPMSPFIADRLNLLATRLTKLANIVQAPPSLPDLPADYHCGNPDCSACNDANAPTTPEGA